MIDPLDQSNPKYYVQGRWFFSKPLEKSLFFIAKMSGLTMIQLASSDFCKAPLVSSLHSPHCPMVLLLIPIAVASYYHYPFFLLSAIILSPLLLLSPDTLPPTSVLYCTRDEQNNNFAHASRSFVHCLALIALL